MVEYYNPHNDNNYSNSEKGTSSWGDHNAPHPKKDNRKSLSFWLKVLWYGLVATLVVFSFINVEPYYQSMKFLLGGPVESALSIVKDMPLVNGLALAGYHLLFWISGFCLWVVLQLLEILLPLLTSNKEFVRTILNAHRVNGKYAVDESDDNLTRNMKLIYNRIPFIALLAQLKQVKYGAYIVDLLICLTVYSPVKNGDVFDFLRYLSLGMTNQIDWANVIMIPVTLFAVEALVGIAILIYRLRGVITLMFDSRKS